jgi:hypothetical protein
MPFYFHRTQKSSRVSMVTCMMQLLNNFTRSLRPVVYRTAMCVNPDDDHVWSKHVVNMLTKQILT